MRPARGELVALRLTVVGWKTLDWRGDEKFFPRQAYRSEQLIQKAARHAYKRLTEAVFLAARCLADQHYFCICGAFSWNRIPTGLPEPAFPAGVNFCCNLFEQCFPVHDFIVAPRVLLGEGNERKEGNNLLSHTRGKNFLVKRSNKVSVYSGKWFGVNGYFESGKSLLEAALKEMREETSIKEENLFGQRAKQSNTRTRN